jgi:hypothetical protein
MRTLNLTEVQQVSGGTLTVPEAAGLILGLASLAATPIVLAVALGGAGGLLVAKFMAEYTPV